MTAPSPVGVGEIDAGRLVLRPIRHEVALALFEGRTPEGVAFAPGYPSRFSLEVMDLLAGPRAAELAGRGTSYFVVRREDDTVLGEIGFHLDTSTGTAQVGYSLVEPAWGKGYATESLRALVADLLSRPDVTRVLADTLVGHGASRRVMEKAGMRLVDERTGKEAGEVVDLVVYQAP